MDARWVLPVVVAAALAGCAGGEPAPADSPIELTAELSDDTLAPGEVTNLTVTVENVADEPYRYEHPGCPPEPIRAEAVPDGEGIRLYPYGSQPTYGACAIRNVTLEPGEKLQTTVHWNGHAEPAQPDPHGGERLEPGEHTLRVELARADDGPGFALERTVTLEE